MTWEEFLNYLEPYGPSPDGPDTTAVEWREPLGPYEVRNNYAAYKAILAKRVIPKRYRVEARLLAKSATPTLQQISPYKEALAVYEFEVTKSSEPGIPEGSRLRAATWVWLDGKKCPIDAAKLQTVMPIQLESFDDNPQLKSNYRSDTLDFDLDMEPYYLSRP